MAIMARLDSDWLAARAQATPERPAVVLDREIWTYRELDHQVSVAAAGLWKVGVRPGNRVAFWRLSRRDALVLVWAVARVGAVLVPFHDRWTSRERAAAVRLVSPHLAVLPESSPSEGVSVPSVSWAQVQFLGRQVEGKNGLRFPTRQVVQGVVFTSGSTGTPKAAILTWANHFWSAWASAARLGLVPNDAWLLSLPLYHVGGLAILWRSVLYGTAVVLPPAEGSFDPDVFKHLPFSRPPSLISLVPTMLYRLLSAGVRPWPELRLVLVGGAAAPASLLEEAIAKGWPVALTYGMTEAASQIATAEPSLVRRKKGTVGSPLLFTRVRVQDAEGRALGVRKVGEIVVQGPTVFSGYWGNDVATRRVLQNGWLRTGDEGYLDEEGHLWVLGRSAFAINTGGEKVYPQEVENILLRHPAVAEACVVGVPDVEWGQRVTAVLVLKPDRRADVQSLEALCREHLAGYKIPRRWEFWPRLPRTASGKVDRRQVRDALMHGKQAD